MSQELATLETIDDGNAIKRTNFELRKALLDIHDIENKDPEKARVVTLKIQLKANSEGKQINASYTVESKLAADRAGVDTIYADQNGEGWVMDTEQLGLEIPSIGFKDEKKEVEK